MKLDEILKPAGWTTNDIKRIYSGLDHCCRCGCGGKYHDRGTIGFKRILNKLIAGKVTPYPAGKERHVTGAGHNEVIKEVGIDYGGSAYSSCKTPAAGYSNVNYINIPIDETSNRCYCLYNE